MKDIYNNYQNKFISLANLKLNELPDSLEFDGNDYIVKSEFHITLLAVEHIATLINSSKIENLKLEIIDEFDKFTANFSLKDYKVTDEFRLVDIEGNKTIIVMTELKGIVNLFDSLSKKYEVKLPVQPTHITLYTLPTDTFGIPIFSYSHLEQISEAVDLSKIIDLA